MITIQKINNQGQEGVSVRFPYIEPTHEVVKLIEEAGLTDAFRSVGGVYILTPSLKESLRPEKVDDFLNQQAMDMITQIGGAVLQEDKRRHDEYVAPAPPAAEVEE